MFLPSTVWLEWSAQRVDPRGSAWVPRQGRITGSRPRSVAARPTPGDGVKPGASGWNRGDSHPDLRRGDPTWCGKRRTAPAWARPRGMLRGGTDDGATRRRSRRLGAATKAKQSGDRFHGAESEPDPVLIASTDVVEGGMAESEVVEDVRRRTEVATTAAENAATPAIPNRLSASRRIRAESNAVASS